jgi:transposase
MKPYRYINLLPDALHLLEVSYKTDARHHVRQKSHAILLSHAGHKMSELSELFNKHPETIRHWFDTYEREGISGFVVKPGRGLKPKLDKADLDLELFIKKS